MIGESKFIFDVWGDTVNMASRMESHGAPGRIQVTEAVRVALQDKYHFMGRGRLTSRVRDPRKPGIYATENPESRRGPSPARLLVGPDPGFP